MTARFEDTETEKKMLLQHVQYIKGTFSPTERSYVNPFLAKLFEGSKKNKNNKQHNGVTRHVASIDCS